MTTINVTEDDDRSLGTPWGLVDSSGNWWLCTDVETGKTCTAYRADIEAGVVKLWAFETARHAEMMLADYDADSSGLTPARLPDFRIRFP